MLKDSYYIRSLLLTLLALAGFVAVVAAFIYLAGFVALGVICGVVLLAFACLYRPWQKRGGSAEKLKKMGASHSVYEIHSAKPKVAYHKKQATKVKG